MTKNQKKLRQPNDLLRDSVTVLSSSNDKFRYSEGSIETNGTNIGNNEIKTVVRHIF